MVIENATISESAIAGGLSGAITRFLLQPLDVLKIRFQLQVEPIKYKSKSSKYRGIFQAIRTIYRDEKLCGFWKGHNSAQILSVIYGSVQFIAFEELTKVFESVDSTYSKNSAVHLFCGGVSSTLATISSYPFDVVRTRLVSQAAGTKIYRNTTHALFIMMKTEGARSLFKGLSPSILHTAPSGALQFAFYIPFNKSLNNFSCYAGFGETNTISNLIAGFSAGMCSKAIVYPLDVCRKRLQIQGFQEGRKSLGKSFVCSGILDCFVQIYKTESWRGFYKGLQPTLIKAAFVNSIIFTSYDTIMRLFKVYKRHK